MPSLLHSFRRDWTSWSRAERIGAAGLLTAIPLGPLLSVAFAGPL